MNVQYAVVDEVLQLQSVGNLINHRLLTLANLAPVKKQNESNNTQRSKCYMSNISVTVSCVTDKRFYRGHSTRLSP